jgi:hypothetical protein
LQDGQLLDIGGVADVDLEEEAVALGLGQLVDALGLDRVLGGEDEERFREREAPTAPWPEPG